VTDGAHVASSPNSPPGEWRPRNHWPQLPLATRCLTQPIKILFGQDGQNQSRMLSRTKNYRPRPPSRLCRSSSLQGWRRSPL
jgi:hypothetical protein